MYRNGKYEILTPATVPACISLIVQEDYSIRIKCMYVCVNIDYNLPPCEILLKSAQPF